MKSLREVINAMLSFPMSSWEHGVAAQSLCEAGNVELMIPMAYTAVLNSQSDGRLATPVDDFAVSYSAASGEAVLRAFEETKDGFFKDGLDQMMGYLMMYAPRTIDGVMYHSTKAIGGYSAQQIWIDDCFMSPPFLAIMGEFTEATKQFAGYVNYLSDENTGLFYKSYDVEKGQHIDNTLWSTGNAFALLGTARMLTEAAHQSEMEIASDLSSAASDMIRSMVKFQTDDGFFHHTIDQTSTNKDIGAALMFATSIYRGIYDGWLDDSYKGNADRAYDSATKLINMHGFICTEQVKPTVLTQAAYIMCDTWRKKAEL